MTISKYTPTQPDFAPIPTSYVPAKGELVTDTDTGKLKLGNGVNTVFDLNPANPDVPAAVTWSTLDGKPSTFPPTIGSTGSTAVAGNDARLTDARTPTTHTHTSGQITDLTEAVQDIVAGLLASGTNVSLSYDDAGNSLTINAAGGGSGGLDAEAVRDAIGVALVGLGNVAVVVNDAADTITITTTATVNDTDANLRDRGTHTGFQAVSTITGLQALLDAKQPLNANLTALAGLTGVADRTNYFTAAGTMALAPFTSAGRALAGGADANAQRSSLANVRANSVVNSQASAFTVGTTSNTIFTYFLTNVAAVPTLITAVGSTTIEYRLVNETASAINVVPFTGQSINGAAANAAFSLPAGATIVLASDNVGWRIVASSGLAAASTDSRFQVYEVNFGDGRAAGTAYDLAHGKGTKSVMPFFQDNYTGRIYNLPDCVPVDNNTLRVTPDVALTANQIHAYLLCIVGSSDVTAPTVPTVTAGTPTSSTIPITISGSTDAVGVAGYNVDVNGTYVTTIYTTSYIVTGLTPSTAYTIGVTPFDLGRNPGPRGTASASTSAVPANVVAFTPTAGLGSAQNVVTGSAAALAIPGGGVGRKLVAVLELSHVSPVGTGSFSTLTATSDKGTTGSASAALTKVGSASIGANNSNQGSIHTFVLDAPAAGVSHVVSVNATTNNGNWMDGARLTVYYIANCGAISLKSTRADNGSASTLNTGTFTGLAANSKLLLAWGGDNALGTVGGGGDASLVSTGGGTINGTGDYQALIIASAQTTVPAITASGSAIHTWIAMEATAA